MTGASSEEAERPKKSAAPQLSRRGRHPDASASRLGRMTLVPEVANTITPYLFPDEPRPLVGRHADLEAVMTMLLRSDTRLITIVGPGGVGKTRLALEVARHIHPTFDVTHFTDLSPIQDSHLLIPKILENQPAAGALTRPDHDTVAVTSTSSSVLLLLDNCEHIADAGMEIAELILTYPQVKILATSRTALHIRWERLYRLDPLPVPPADHQFPPAELAKIPSVELLVDRIRDVRPEFELTDETAPLIAGIAIRLDGVPLALELAARQCRVLSVRLVSKRVTEQPSALGGGPRDLPERHQSLRKTIQRSYDLLSEEEQFVLRTGAVFADGASISDLDAVVTPSPTVPLFDVLMALADASLVTLQDGAHDHLRVVMLSIVRDYLLRELERLGESNTVYERLARHWESLANRVTPRSSPLARHITLEHLDREHTNLASAIEWSLDARRFDLVADLVWGLRHYWDARDHLDEGARWVQQILDADVSGATAACQSQILATGGYLSARMGNYRTAVDMLLQAREVWSGSIDDEAYGELLIELAEAQIALGQIDQARHLITYLQSLDDTSLSQELRSRAAVADAMAATSVSDWDDQADRALADLRDVLLRDNHFALATRVSMHGAQTALAMGNARKASSWLCDDLRGSASILDQRTTALGEIALGDIAAMQGSIAEALDHYQTALSLATRRVDADTTASSAEGIAILLMLVGEEEQAAQLLQAVAIHRAHYGIADVPARRVRLVPHMPHTWRVDAVSASQLATISLVEHVEVALAILVTRLVHPQESPPTHETVTPLVDADLLSKRERDVVRLVSGGLTNRQIALALGIAERTVDSHVGNVLRKLKVQSRAQVAAWAVRQGLAPGR